MGEPKSQQLKAAIDQRYYALDALRASMMLLGLVFHSVISYTCGNL